MNIEFSLSYVNFFTRKRQEDHREKMRLADRGSQTLALQGLVRLTV
ncbi:MAG: hypothetical protein QG641_900 [Candidatus Poribacteria bacterium]|nr:hypothetical protein [Candidatus Poribacteria bacterium]